MTTSSSSSTLENQPPTTISIILSQKGKPMVELNKYLFKLNRVAKIKKYWICTSNGCPAKIHTDIYNDFIQQINKHCHPAGEEKAIREFREKVKARAIQETTPIPRIYDEECEKAMMSLAAISLLPSEREINSAINKARRRLTPAIPTTQLFEIPDSFTKTLRNNVFLITDKMITRRQRMILFGSSEQLKLLFTAETILMDGTFSSCPQIFDQVYTIHCIKFEQSFPCIFGLLPNKFKTTYQFLIRELKSVASGMKVEFTPKIVMSDFEPALIGVVKIQFPTATHLSCYFHFTQAVYRNIQRLGLASIYNNDDDIKHFCRQLMALPLLPESTIDDTYDQLLENLSPQIRETMNGLLNYFQDQWFTKIPISQWCVHGLSMRTNNNAEAFRSRFNRRVQIYHPNIWSFIKCLQGEENRFFHMYTQFNASLGARKKQAKTIAFQHRIDNLIERYYGGVITVMEYLNGLSFTVAQRKK